jgi:hypothetical protein
MNGNGCLDRGFEEIVTGLGGSIWICTGLSGAGIAAEGLINPRMGSMDGSRFRAYFSDCR